MTIRILYYNEGENPNEWLPALAAALPHADIRLWQKGDDEPADYALVWHPPDELLHNRRGLKAVFNLAAGVDALLSQNHLIPENVPVFRLEDAGMAIQMAEYATYATLRYYRRFDEYERQARMKVWDMLNPEVREHFTVGIMGMGVMGTAIAKALVPFRFPLRGWSRTRKERDGVTCYYGDDQLTRFLDGLRLLICVLPLTPETAGILNLANFRHLGHGACLINLGRGEHLVDDDLLCAMAEGRIRAAMLDVTSSEPLPPEHPFWEHDNITITPHIAGLTFCHETVSQIASMIAAFERGEELTARVDRNTGY